MNVVKYSRVIRPLVNATNASAWDRAEDKLEFCSDLLGLQHEHPIINEIVAGTLSNLLALQSNKCSV
ncbi:hypothetical protein [Neptuniibacter halophilus]|uniref:hypothetical protein n=1 Tax=Neptuniibacter halophilus TaxID=651666 RepID=UPI0025729545|nr:hypothetical protein [Neptuniibacter halophilus]